MEKSTKNRRIVLVPTPGQGHLTPFLLLAKSLQLKGFSITFAQTQSKQKTSSFSGFDFLTIPETLAESEIKKLGSVEFMMKLNETSKGSFKNCVSKLLLQGIDDVVCIIYDELMYFCEEVAYELKIPSVVFTTCSAANQVCCSFLRKVDSEKFLIDIKDPEMQEKVVENLYPLKYKHLPISGYGPLERFLEICKEIFNKRSASGLIINTSRCLESSSLTWLQQELGIPVYPIGPLHITSSDNTSLLEEDRSCFEWLNKQEPNSVIYISLGSKLEMETKEVLEMAWGLFQSKQSFLWVIRPESLPEEIQALLERGYIVKWAPQDEVLAHPAVRGFWSHCGWNSTLESIAEGVPMICRPNSGEQKLNAMYIESVWNVGIKLEGQVERGDVERTVKRLMVDEEGEGLRERVLVLKEKMKDSVTSGGSSYNALDEFVKYLETKYKCICGESNPGLI